MLAFLTLRRRVCTLSLKLTLRGRVCTLGLELTLRGRVCTLSLKLTFRGRVYTLSLKLRYEWRPEMHTHTHKKKSGQFGKNNVLWDCHTLYLFPVHSLIHSTSSLLRGRLSLC